MKRQFVIRQPKKLLLAVSIIIMLFMVPIENATNGIVGILFKNLDEIFAAISLFLIIKHHRHLKNVQGLVYYFAFLMVGILSTFVYGQQPLRSVFLDFICCSKYILSFAGIYCFSSSHKDDMHLRKYLGKLAKIALFLLTVYCISQLIIYGGRTAVTLFNAHPVNTCHIAVGLYVLTVLQDGIKKQKIWMVFACIGCLSSLTTKGAGVALIIILISEFQLLIKGRYRWAIYILLFVGIILIGYDSFQMFFLNKSAARAILLKNSISIAASHHGIGLGYAMYGSSQAAATYSPIYYSLGFNSRFGMTSTKYSYLTDSFWPIILGEFGIIGLCLFIAYLIKLGKKIVPIRLENYEMFVVCIIIYGYFFIMSTSSTAFFNPIAVPYGAILAIAIANVEHSENILQRLKGNFKR